MESKTIQTKTRGTVTVTEKQCFTFEHGLLGFADYTEFALIDAETTPFFWLQSCQEPALAFLVVDPFLLRDDYEADIDDEALSAIGLSKPSEVLLLTTVTLPGDGSGATVNLQGPLIFNKANNRAFQAILSDPRWPTKYPLAKGGAHC
jgi:flagellar assembly factor FliW